ncbi:MAG TPA: DUF1080 domain-containing protein, partial [Chitinophagaceae bacterium]|nr:DUF1080 domain-containing protein [Chitinophagaceae bacterium]
MILQRMKFFFNLNRFLKKGSITRPLLILCALGTCHTTFGQTAVPLTDLSFFQTPGPSWKISGDAKGGFSQKDIQPTPGTGVLINAPASNTPGKDLYTTMQHGDMDLELDYMMAAGSNSGIYMQGRYEIQLLDSWGVINPTSGDNAGIYERWNDSKPEGQKGYDGHAPRQNAGRAPGLWQHMKISFQAPRFKGTQKIENAKIIRVELNGVAVQENVELAGPTRGAMGNDEVPAGPLRFQGDHGPVAFRNIKIATFDKPRPELVNLKYSIYKGKYESEPDYKKPPEAEGSSVILSSNVNNYPNEFLIRYTGTLRVKEPGEYTFNVSTPGGVGSMKIKNQVVVPLGERRGTGKVTLPAGEFEFDMLYSKFIDFAKPALGLAVAGPGIREYILSDVNVASADPVDPIMIHAPVNTNIRSFTDLADSVRITHAVNVGSAQQLHYTYDMDKGMIVQVWRGGFLDATPMWHSRGDGSSRPLGAVQRFGKPMLAVAKLGSADAVWPIDTAGTGFRPKGYVLDASDRPSFKYQVYNTSVTDVTRVTPDNHGLHRDITLESPSANL